MNGEEKKAFCEDKADKKNAFKAGKADNRPDKSRKGGQSGKSEKNGKSRDRKALNPQKGSDVSKFLKAEAVPGNPRSMALEALIKMKMPPMWGAAEGYSNLITDAAIKKAGDALSDLDRGLFVRMVAGVTERRITLDWILSKLSSRPLQKLDEEVLNILRLGIWQLRYSDRIPEHAAVNETVNLAGKYTRGYVNGILRSYLRQKDEIVLPAGNGAADMSVRYSTDRLLVAEYIRTFGPNKTEKILEASFAAPGLTLRTNTLKITREELVSVLTEEGFECELTANSDKGIKIKSGSGIPSALKEGLCFVQDEASQLVCLARTLTWR